MGTKTSTLAIKIVSDASGAPKGFDEAERSVGGFSDKLDKASLVAGGALAAVVGLGKGALDAASDLQQSTGAINSVFGDWAIDIEQSAQAAQDAVGLSTSSYENLASVIGAQLRGAGMSLGDTTDKTQQLIAKGADLAATFGGTTADAVEALSSVLKGETDPIERYGVSIKQADISARLAAEGHDKLTGTALKTATANAALAIVMEQTKSSMGSFGAEANTAEGQQQRLSAAWENAQAKIGTLLLPALTGLLGLLGQATSFANEHTTAVLIVGGVLAGFAAAVLIVNGAVTAYEAVMKIATAAQWLWNIAMDANPIAIVVIGIAALVAGFILAYNKCKPFRDAINALGDVFGAVFKGIGWFFDKFLVQPLEWAWGKIKDVAALGQKVAGWLGFGAAGPAPAPAPGGGGGGAVGLYGAARTPTVVRTASMLGGFGGGGTSSSGGGIGGDTTVVNITVNGALDPLSVGRQLASIMRDYARSTGGQVSVNLR